MAISKKEYTPTKHTGIKVHNNKIDYWFDFRINGKRYSRLFKAKLNHTSKDRLKSAYEALEATKEAITKELSIDADTSATVNDYWEKIKKLPGKRGKLWTQKVRTDMQYYYDKYLTGIGSMKIRDVQPTHITDLKIDMNHLSPRYQKKAFEILLPVFALAMRHKIIDASPIHKDDIPKRNSNDEKKTIDGAVAKYKRLHKALYLKFKDNPHHLAFFLFGFHGRRLGEVNTLTWGDIDLNNNSYIIRGKNSKVNTDLTFALPNEIEALLVQFKGRSVNSDNVFNIKEAKCHYADIRTKSGIKEFTFHWMRNLSVSALSSMGADVTHLSAMLGHVDGQTLKKYLTLQNEESTKATNAISSQLLQE